MLPFMSLLMVLIMMLDKSSGYVLFCKVASKPIYTERLYSSQDAKHGATDLMSQKVFQWSVKIIKML